MQLAANAVPEMRGSVTGSAESTSAATVVSTHSIVCGKPHSVFKTNDIETFNIVKNMSKQSQVLSWKPLLVFERQEFGSA